MSNQYNFKTLIGKYRDGQCSEEEKIVIESWLASELQKDLLSPSVFEIEAADVRMREVIDKHTLIRQSNSSPLWPRLVAAASILIFIGIGFYFYQNYDPLIPTASSQHDIAPGGNKAFLTLANGKRITLTDAKNGELAEQSGVKITKAADGQLVYTVSNVSNENNKKAYNTIETPRGGTYQVRLPDGTKVWLNAASTLRFPSSFARLVNRRVELLSGEAYFEVAKDKKHPFIVQTDRQDVEVLGTHFNINNYPDEASVKTTLLEGSIKIRNKFSLESKILKPNQQAAFTKEEINVTNVDAEEAIAWKNGLFTFDNESIESVMRKIARWYNVDVEFKSKNKDQVFSGTISRFENVSKVLEKLELTGGVHFKIEERRILVMK
ncbi:FecR domain-containing protein [Pedobacter sp. FW305-3-2-15-E-R2A2]|uniref:FecR family protein n=1 Tax=Pedobacter sp. FW305-3-2-15-E-R2A2 TaxID=3140251 RepID=UPI00313FEB1F